MAGGKSRAICEDAFDQMLGAFQRVDTRHWTEWPRRLHPGDGGQSGSGRETGSGRHAGAGHEIPKPAVRSQTGDVGLRLGARWHRVGGAGRFTMQLRRIWRPDMDC